MSRKRTYYGYSFSSGIPIVTDNLIVYLDAGVPASYSGSGVDWFDLTAESNDATLINGVPYSSLDGGYFDFDGVSDYADILGWSDVLSSPITFSCWISPNDTSSTQLLVCYGKGTGANLSYLAIVSGSFWWVVNNTSVAQSSIPIGSWFHLTGTYDSSLPSANVKLYVNAVEVDTQNFTNPLSTQLPPQFRIGRRVDFGTSANYNGKLSQTLVYTKALSAAEILQNFNSTKDRYGL